MSERTEQQVEEVWDALRQLREEVERGTHESTTVEEMEGLFRHVDRLEQRIKALEARDDQ